MPRVADDLMLPIEPFAQWMRWVLRVTGNSNAAAALLDSNPTTVLDIAKCRHRDGSPRKEVPLRLVDGMMIAADMDDSLYTIYPELAEC